MKTSQSKIKRLKLFSFKLNSLLSITKAINANLSTEDLLERYEKILREELNIGRVLIYKYNYNNEDWEIILKSGCGEEVDEIDMESDILGHEEIAFVTASPNPSLRTFDNIIPVFNNNQPIAYVLIGDIDEETKGVSPTIKHLHFIQTLSNIIIVAIENIRLYNESLRQEALKKELELASRMQSMLIPDAETLPKSDNLFVSTFYHPHFDVGGDYYDFIKLNEKEFGLCIADVSGKGISAALLMSNFQANLRALFTADVPMKRLVNRLNQRVISSAKGEKFITLFIARYNMRTRQLSYVNAGHNPPLFYEIKSGKLKHLKSGCIGIGMLDELPFVNVEKLQIDTQVKMLTYTDGLVEIIQEEGRGISWGTKFIEDKITNEQTIGANINSI